MRHYAQLYVRIAGPVGTMILQISDARRLEYNKPEMR